MMSGKMYRFRVSENKVNPRFIAGYLQSMRAQLAIDDMKTGGSDSGLNLTHSRFRRLRVPIAPRAEQDRVVAAIEEHFSRLDAAEAALCVSRERNSRLRRALLARLGTGIKPVALGDVSIEAHYGTSIRCSYDGPGWPVLRIPNIQNGHIDIHDMKFASDANTDLKPYQIERGDLLFVRTNGSRDLIGRVAVVDTDDRLAFASYLIRVRPDERRLDARFAALALASPQCREQIETKAATTAGQYNLNLRSIASLEIPLPPIEQQHRLTTEIDSQLTVLDSVSRTIEQTLLRAQSLRRSILDQAFAGALVPRDPGESVSRHLAEDQGKLVTFGRLRRRKMND
jgi:type I restriction enzyme S subunit